MKTTATSKLVFPDRNPSGLRSRSYFPVRWWLLLVILSFSTFMESRAQYSFAADNEDAITAYDELLVTTYLESSWNFNTHMIITNENILFVKVEDLFKNLEIPCTMDENETKMTGFVENETKNYVIDFDAKQITIGPKAYKVQKELIKEAGSMYLESNMLAQAFGLNLTFNPRSLSAKLVADFELPKIKQKRLEKTRSNIARLRGEPVATDTVVKRNYHLFKFGTMDWGVAMDQTMSQETHNSLSLGLGAELLYGEANVSAYYDDRYKFDNRQLRYSWRFVDNESKLLKQAQLGNIYNPTIATLNYPVIGASLRNSPTTLRRASGFYTISENTEPNWTVELYINDILVNYTVADASGLFVFNVPNVYGYNQLKLKFYGPLGEERTEERTLNVPFTFMPANVFEYGLSGGVLQDGNNSRFGRADFNYGVNRFLTFGGGIEYLSSIPNSPFIPFTKIGFQPFSKLVLNLEYAHNVRIKGLLNYYLTQSASLELGYAKYKEGQQATLFNALVEKNAAISVPFTLQKVSGFTKLTFNQFDYEKFNYQQTNLMVSAHYKQFSANSSTLLNWVSKNPIYGSTLLSMSAAMKNGLLIRPSAQYNLNSNSFMLVKADVEKRVSRAYFSVSYERNFETQNDNLYFSFRYDLPFMRTNLTGSYSNNKFRFSESAQGSIAFDGDNKYLRAGSNSALGKGGILFYPFFDRNNNGVMDPGEKLILLTRVKVTGGSAEISKKDSIVRVSDLNAFVDYNVEFTDLDMENVAWRFKYKKYRVVVDPNQYKHICVPVISVGEVSGNAYLQKSDTLVGISRILVKFYPKNSKKMVAETLSEADGYLYYLGLAPGDYVARIDSTQLSNLNDVATPPQFDFTIKTVEQGDVVEGMNFTLRSTLPTVPDSSIFKPANHQVTVVKVEASKQVENPATESSLSSDYLSIKNETTLIYWQVGAFKLQANAQKMAETLSAALQFPVGVYQENGWYKVRFGGFATRGEANLCRKAILDHRILPANLIMEIHLSKSVKTPSLNEKNQSISQPVINKKQDLSTNKSVEHATTESIDLAESPLNPQTGHATIREPVHAKKATMTEVPAKQEISINKELPMKQVYYVQVAAFIHPNYATRKIKSMPHLTSCPVAVVYRDQFYKVRFGPFETVEALNACKEKIVAAGILQIGQLKIDREEMGSTPAADQVHLSDGYHIQVGAFIDKSMAIGFYQKMAAEFPFPLMMVEEEGYYKIRFGPFKSASDLTKCRKALEKNQVNFMMRSNRVKYF